MLKKINFEVVCKIIGILIIIIVNIKGVFESYMPSVINDEFGYWLSAAYFAEKDWSSIAQGIFYYSYGYGLVLSPLVALIDNYEVLYKAAVSLNILWLSLSFLLLYSLSTQWFSDISKKVRMVISLVVTLYSYNICLTNYTLPEIYLFFLNILITWILCKLLKKDNIFLAALLSFFCIYSYTVHQRMITVIIAVGIAIIFAKYKRLLSLKSVFAFLIMGIVMFKISILIKNVVISEVWLDNLVTLGNDYVGQISKIKHLFTSEGFSNFLYNISGRLLYLMISTVGIAFYVFWDGMKNIKNRFCRMTVNDIEYFYMIIAIILSVGMSAVFLLYPDHTTHLLYGRYFEHLYGGILLWGMLSFWKKNISTMTVLIFPMVSVILTVIITIGIKSRELPIANYAINSVAFSWIYKYDFNIYLLVFVTSILFFLLAFGKKLMKEKAIILFLVIGIYFNLVGTEALHSFQARYYESLTASTTEVKNLITSVENIINEKLVVYTVDDNSGVFCSGAPIQYVFPDRKVYYFESIKQYKKNNTEMIIISAGNINKIENLHRIKLNGMFSVWISPNHNYFSLIMDLSKNEMEDK